MKFYLEGSRYSTNMAGFTKSFRDKWTHPVFRDLLEASIWAWMCDTAVWEETRINYCGQMVSLSRGQLITSRSFISKGFRVGEQSIRTLLARLENDGMINQLPTSHGTIITICNYSKYQDFQPATNQTANQPLTSGQPAPNQNKKELKEGKERKKEEDCSPAIESLREPTSENTDFSLIENCGECFEKVPARMVIKLPKDWELPQKWGDDMEKLGHYPDDIVVQAEKFFQYWTSGKGAGKRRSVKGWRQSWGNWMDKSKEWKAR